MSGRVHNEKLARYLREEVGESEKVSPVDLATAIKSGKGVDESHDLARNDSGHWMPRSLEAAYLNAVGLRGRREGRSATEGGAGGVGWGGHRVRPRRSD